MNELNPGTTTGTLIRLKLGGILDGATARTAAESVRPPHSRKQELHTWSFEVLVQAV